MLGIVLLKAGLSTTFDEFLVAAFYVLSEGNYNLDPHRKVSV